MPDENQRAVLLHQHKLGANRLDLLLPVCHLRVLIIARERGHNCDAPALSEMLRDTRSGERSDERTVDQDEDAIHRARLRLRLHATRWYLTPAA